MCNAYVCVCTYNIIILCTYLSIQIIETQDTDINPEHIEQILNTDKTSYIP